MKKRMYIIIIILILIFIILNFYKSKNNIFNDIMIFSLWSNIGDKNEYVINPKKEDNVQIDVLKTIHNGTEIYNITQDKMQIYKKIAPGSYGQFTIRLVKSSESNCKIILKDTTNKPENLVFILDEQEYYSIKEMQEKLNKIFKVQDKVVIDWQWIYDNNSNGDIEDTKDGRNLQKYGFEIQAIIE